MSFSYVSLSWPRSHNLLRRAVTVLLFAALAENVRAQQSTRLLGTLRDAKTGAAIPDAAITVRGSSRRTQSDAQGKWVLAGFNG
jgi:hypothetical protein